MDTLEHSFPSTRPVQGIVIFSRSMQVKWANQQARDLIAQTAESLPLEVVDLAAKMLDELETRIADPGWAHIEANRSVHTPVCRLELLGYGFPGLDEFTNFPLMVLITDTKPDEGLKPAHSPWQQEISCSTF